MKLPTAGWPAPLWKPIKLKDGRTLTTLIDARDLILSRPRTPSTQRALAIRGGAFADRVDIEEPVGQTPWRKWCARLRPKGLL
jgi:hypothetical protein